MSLHADARRTLATWAPPDLAQGRLREDFLAFLDEHPDAVWRTCDAGHLTAGALVVDPAAGQVLLNLHGRIRRWVQFGGHAEDGDRTWAGVARRETEEESGLTGVRLSASPLRLDRHPAPCRPGGGIDHLDVVYLAVVPSHAAVRASEESLDVAWFDWDRLPPECDDSVRDLVIRARAAVPGPGPVPSGPQDPARATGSPRVDDTDLAILRLLAEDARIANNALAARVGIAPSTCLARVRSLHERGILGGSHADVDLARLGRPLQAIVAVRLGSHSRDVVRGFHAALHRIPGVISIFHMAGEDDYLIHVAVASAPALRDLILDHLTVNPAVRHTETHLVFEHLRGRGGVP